MAGTRASPSLAHGLGPRCIGKSTDEEHAPFHGTGDDDEDEDPDKEPWVRWLLIVLCLIAMWWTGAVCITLVIKKTVGSPGAKHEPGPFPYSFALTALTNAFTAPIAWTIARVAKTRTAAPTPSLRRSEAVKLVLIGCLQGMEIGCNNKAVEFLPVSKKTMLHSMFVLFVMVTARFWQLERMGGLKVLAAGFIILGGVFQSWAAEQHHVSASVDVQHLYGGILMCVGMTLGAQRWALIQIAMHGSPENSNLARLTKLDFAARVLPIAGFVTLLLALLFESEFLSLDKLTNEAVLWAVPTVGSLVVVLTLAELCVVRRTSAVALQVLATLHQIPIAFVSAAVFHEQVHALSVCGFGLCILAAFAYVLARRKEKREQVEESQRDPPSPPLDVKEEQDKEFDAVHQDMAISAPDALAEDSTGGSRSPDRV